MAATDDGDEDAEQYLTSANSQCSFTVYHTTRACPDFKSIEEEQARSERYVEWHELEQCERCAALEASTNDRF